MFSKYIETKPHQISGRRAQNGKYGVEIEVEGTGFEAVFGWTNHNEGSLRGGGTEYVTLRDDGTPGPVSASGLMARMRALEAHLKKCAVRESHRTSTHIHYNMNAEPMQHVIGNTVVFTAIEPIFMRLCGQQRDGNLFCLPSYDTGDVTTHFVNVCRAIETGAFHNIPQRGKYCAQNWGQLFNFGTLEYRCFPYTSSTDDVMAWSSWIDNIHQIVLEETKTDPSYRQFVKGIQMRPLEYCDKIFGKSLVGIKDARVDDLVQYGCQTAYELTRVLRHYFNKKPKEVSEVPEMKMKTLREIPPVLDGVDLGRERELIRARLREIGVMAGGVPVRVPTLGEVEVGPVEPPAQARPAPRRRPLVTRNVE